MIEEISSTLPNMPRLPSQTTNYSQNESQVNKKSNLRESGDIADQVIRARQQVLQSSFQATFQQPPTRQHHILEQSPASPIATSSKKVKLSRLVGKLNKSLEDFFLKDAPEDSSYVDDTSMIKHYANN